MLGPERPLRPALVPALRGRPPDAPAFCLPPGDREPAWAAAPGPCPGCAFVDVREGGLLEAAHVRARDLLLRGCGSQVAVAALLAGWAELQASDAALPAWSPDSAFQHLTAHTADLALQSRMHHTWLGANISALRGTCWRSGPAGAAAPVAGLVKLLVRLQTLQAGMHVTQPS